MMISGPPLEASVLILVSTRTDSATRATSYSTPSYEELAFLKLKSKSNDENYQRPANVFIRPDG